MGWQRWLLAPYKWSSLRNPELKFLVLLCVIMFTERYRNRYLVGMVIAIPTRYRFRHLSVNPSDPEYFSVDPILSWLFLRPGVLQTKPSQLCMPTPSSRLSNPTSACPHCHLCLPIPSSRLSNSACQHPVHPNLFMCPHPVQGCPPQSLYVPTPQFRRTPPLHAHTLSNPTSACPHPVQGCRTPPLYAHTQFKAVKPQSLYASRPTSACPHPVQGCRTPPLHAHTQFKAVEPHLCMPTPSSRLSIWTPLTPAGGELMGVPGGGSL